MDSPRWCATHKSYGDHHTDRCPRTFDPSPEAAQVRMLAQARRLAARPTPPVHTARPGWLARLRRRATLRATR